MNDEARTPDWDGVLTFLLTVLVGLASLGGAYLITLYKVIEKALIDRARTEPSHLILVPGKRLVEDRPDEEFLQRLQAAGELAQAQKIHQIIILGGVTHGARISEAQAGEHYLRSVPGGQRLEIVLESRSQNTLTNLRNVRAILETSRTRPEVTFISNRYHLARLGLIASSLRIPHRLWPAEDEFTPDGAMTVALLREALFYLWFIVGKTWATITANTRMLDRVT